MLNMFNGNVSDSNQYVNWLYENDIFVFKERVTTTVDEIEAYTYEIQINDPYQTNNYSHTWYRDGVQDDTIQGLTYVWTPNYEKDEYISVLTYDGEYYSITKFTIKRIGVDIVFDINESANTVTATLEGEGLRYTTVADYTFQWYKEDISGEG